MHSVGVAALALGLFPATPRVAFAAESPFGFLFRLDRTVRAGGVDLPAGGHPVVIAYQGGVPVFEIYSDHVRYERSPWPFLPGRFSEEPLLVGPAGVFREPLKDADAPEVQAFEREGALFIVVELRGEKGTTVYLSRLRVDARAGPHGS